MPSRPLLRRATAALAVLSALLLGTPASATSLQPAAAEAVAPPVPLTGPQLAASWTAPLSTRGRWIVDADGNRFKLKSGNWEGAQGTWTGSGDINDPANHMHGIKADDMPLGLDRVPMSTILADFHRLGLNSIRLPFSNALVHNTTPVPDAAVAANPQLKGKTPSRCSTRPSPRSPPTASR